MEKVTKLIQDGFKFDIYIEKGCFVSVTKDVLVALTNNFCNRYYCSYDIDNVIDTILKDGLSEYNTDINEINELRTCSKLLDEEKVDFIEFELAI